jgi:hypothetical protein
MAKVTAAVRARVAAAEAVLDTERMMQERRATRTLAQRVLDTGVRCLGPVLRRSPADVERLNRVRAALQRLLDGAENL